MVSKQKLHDERALLDDDRILLRVEMGTCTVRVSSHITGVTDYITQKADKQ